MTGAKLKIHRRRSKVFALAGAVAVAVASLLLLLPACRHRPAEEPYLIRLIDVLDRENIVDSPLLDLEADPKAFAARCPNMARMADKYPLLDAGAGPNPLLIKKKIKMGPAQDNALLAPPRTLLRYKLKIPSGSSLEFYYGIYWGWDTARRRGLHRTVEFSVRLQASGLDETLFQREITLGPERNLAFNHKKIDLGPYAGREVALDLLTRGQPDSMALWFNPIIFRPQPEPRNVILISLDTLRGDHLGCYGYGRDTSPNMDKLAADGVIFLNSFAASPWTLPSHVSIVTGLDCINHQVYQSSDRMDPALPTLADFLRARGLLTAAFTGGGFVSGFFGFNKGFDNFRSHGHVADPTQAAKLTKAVLPWIEANRRKSFFLFLHTYQVHNPYVTPEPYNLMFLDPGAELHRVNMTPLRYNHENRYKPPVSEAYRRNIVSLYDGEIRYTDEALIGPLVEALKKDGLYDRTMIVITADHGEEFYEKKSWLHTNAVYDPTLKVPLLVKYPGSRDAGRRVDRYARITDIVPTILDEMGIRYPARSFDGKGLVPLIRGDERGPERMFRSELDSYVVKNHIPAKRAVSRDTYKIILNDPYTPADLAFFAFPPPPTDKLEIYDLAVDPGETTNLALSRPDLARELLKYLQEHLKPSRKVTRQSRTDNREIQKELRALGYIR
jgi:arylsulfatase A-like enzyme